MKDTFIATYRDFILDNLDIPTKVDVAKRMEYKDENGKIVDGMFYTKIGIGPKIKVDIKIIEVNSRSANFSIKFDKYEEEFILFIGRHHSPSDIFDRFDMKISDIVNNTLKKDKRWELIEELEKEERKNFHKHIKNHPIKLTSVIDDLQKPEA